MNRVSLVGRLVNDLELRYTPAGLAIGKVSLAVDRQYSKEKKEAYKSEQKSTADFPRLIITGKSAEFVSKYLHKGSLVSVHGAIRTGSYENAQGQKVYTTEIACERIQALETIKRPEGMALSESEHLNVEDFELEEIPF